MRPSFYLASSKPTCRFTLRVLTLVFEKRYFLRKAIGCSRGSPELCKQLVLHPRNHPYRKCLQHTFGLRKKCWSNVLRTTPLSIAFVLYCSHRQLERLWTQHLPGGNYNFCLTALEDKPQVQRYTRRSQQSEFGLGVVGSLQSARVIRVVA
jgi:hypothetical protein